MGQGNRNSPPQLAWCGLIAEGDVKVDSQDNTNQHQSKHSGVSNFTQVFYREIFFWNPLVHDEVHANESSLSSCYMRFRGNNLFWNGKYIGKNEEGHEEADPALS